MVPFPHDVRYALRTLARTPLLSGAAVFTLALGIGATTTMFGIVDRLFFRAPALVRHPGRVVRVYVTQDLPPFGASTGSVATYPRYRDLRDHVSGFASLAAFGSRSMTLGRGIESEQVSATAVTASFFPLLGVQAAAGRLFTEDEDRGGAGVVILSHEFWRRHFGGDSSVVGQTVALGKTIYTVIGIAPPGFAGVGFEPVDLWLPIGSAASELGSPLDCKACYWLTTVGRLRPGVSAAQVASEATVIFRHGSAAEPADSAAVVTLGPVQAARGPNASNNARLSLWLGAISLIVLLVACGNVANLLVARASQRQREIATRLALGAGNTRLVRQLLTEGLVLAGIGGCAGLLVALWSGTVLATYLLPRGSGGTTLDGRVLVFTAAIVLVTGVVVSLAPAAHARRPNLTRALKGGNEGSSGQRSVARASLLVAQIALTIVLLVGAALFIRSFENVTAIPLGFDPEHLISASVDLKQVGYKKADINVLYDQMRERVQRLKGVVSASLAVGSPFATSLAVPLELPGVDDSLRESPAGGPYVQVVSPEYFATLGTAIRRGRGFTVADRAGSLRVAVVNEIMARQLWPREDALGKCLKVGRGKGVPCTQVVGVVENVRRNVLTEAPTMQYYLPLSQTDTSFFSPITALLVRTVGPPDVMVASVRHEIQAVSPEVPYAVVRPMRELFEWQLRPWRLGSILFTLFGALALALAGVGLYGVLTYLVTQRTQEIGIRMALGATRRDVLTLVVWQGLKVVVIGVGVGGVAALIAGRLVASLLYGISPSNVAALTVAVGVVLIVSFFASYVPARRASALDPLRALRYE